jgi:hypothetical protein
MPLYFFGPRLSRARVSSSRANRVVSTLDAIQIWEKVQGDYLQGAIVLVANGPKGKGSLSRRIKGRAGYAGGTNTNRYFAQVNDESGNNHTCISTTGVLDLPAAVVALPTLAAYISCRIIGSSFGLSDTFYPQSGESLGQQVPFRGGRG